MKVQLHASVLICAVSVLCSCQRDSAGPAPIQCAQFIISIYDQGKPIATYVLASGDANANAHGRSEQLQTILNELDQEHIWQVSWVTFAPGILIRTSDDDFNLVGSQLVWNPMRRPDHLQLVRDLSYSQRAAIESVIKAADRPAE